jgi:DNA helicase HerA-like ATPase
MFDPTGHGRGLVLDVSGLDLEEVQRAATAFMLRKIYREMFRWGESRVMRLAVVLDEAHRLAKDRTLPKLMKEGRKFGVSVIVASQSLSDFEPDIIRNVGAKFIFRTNFPASKHVAGFLRGRDGVDLSQTIENLGVGQAFVSTPDNVKARKVFMYE